MHCICTPFSPLCWSFLTWKRDTSDNETKFGGGPQCKKICFKGQHRLYFKFLDLIVGVETFAILLILLGDRIWWILCTIRHFFIFTNERLLECCFHMQFKWVPSNLEITCWTCDNIWRENGYILLTMKAHYDNQTLSCERLCCKVFGARICQARITMTSWHRNLRRTSR